MTTPTIDNLVRRAEAALDAAEGGDADEAADELEALVHELRTLREAAPDAVLAEELGRLRRRLAAVLRMARRLDDLDLGRLREPRA